MWLSGELFLWYTAGSLEHHLTCSGSQSQHRVWMILDTHRASHVIMPNLIQPCFVLALHASVQNLSDTSVRGAPGSRVQHVKILSNSCILDRWLPKLHSHLNRKGFQC